MAFTGTEYLEVCVGAPYDAVAVDNYIVASGSSGGATIPSFSFTVFNLNTNTAKLYGGLPADSVFGNVAYANRAWVCVRNGEVVGINPANGSITSSIAGNLTDGILVVASGSKMWTVSTRAVKSYNMATNTFGTTTTTETSVNQTAVAVANDGRLVITTATLIKTYDISGSTPSLVSTATKPLSRSTNGYGAALGNKVYFISTSGSYYELDTTTDIVTLRTATPAGMPSSIFYSGAIGYKGGATVGPDGNLYYLPSSGDGTMVALNPVTGEWKRDTLPTTRANRYKIVSAGNKLWIPTGEPIG